MSDTNIGRRGFLKAAATTGLTIVGASAVKGAAANARVRIGLIGCGGRGKWIGDIFNESGLAQVTAVYDYFKDRTDEAGERLKVDASRRFVGLEGYRQLIASDVDAVAVESPPYFHPEQTVAAIDAGKHVYLAKPIAVDVPGCMAILKAAQKASGKLSVLVDFQTRVDPFYQEAIKRVHEGLIGQPVAGQVYYWAGRLGKQAEGDSPMARLRNWVFDKALSGDIIVEQNIHVLDVANWILRGHPLKAIGTGGRKSRTDVGDCWDHFMVHYTYADDVLMDFSSGQFTQGYDDLCCRVYGPLGTIDTHYGGQVYVRARSNPYKGGVTTGIYREGAVTNVKNFCAAIQAGQQINNAEESANSTLTAILGRIAAYERRVVTWDEMIQANTKLDAKLELPPDGVNFKG